MRLKHTSLYNNVHFLALALILLIFTLKYWWIGILLFIYLVFLIKRTKLIKGVLWLFVGLGISYMQYIPVKLDYQLKGIIIACDETSIEILTFQGKVKIYGKHQLSLGDYGVFDTEDYHFSRGAFDYETYLKNRGIKACRNYVKSEIFGNHFVLGKIQQKLINYVQEKNTQSAEYLITLLLGANWLDSNLNTQLNSLGISHLMAISGLHIMIIVGILKKFLDWLIISEKCKANILILFLSFYMLVTNLAVSVVRAAMMVILEIIFKRKKHLYTKLDILSMITILILMLKPKYLFLVGFQLSFLISFILITFLPMLIKKNAILESLKLTLIAFLVSLPIVININYEINFLTLLVSPLFAFYFEIILLPVTIIIFLIPPLERIFKVIYYLFESGVEVFAEIDVFTLIVGKIDVFWVLLYYLLLFLMLGSFNKQKSLFKIIFVIYLLFILFNPLINNFPKVTFYDVGQGDSTLIYVPNEATILVDAYGDVANLLKRDGIKKIDYLIITHTDLDHYQALDEVAEAYQITEVYTSLYTDITKLSGYELILLKAGDVLKCKSINLKILSPALDYNNDNNNSLVLQFQLTDYRYLLTGDIEKAVESDLVNKYQTRLESDILKVAHHGSKSSSTPLFLNYVNPEYYIISVGKANYYGLPNNEYLLGLNKVLRTDIHQTIVFRHYQDKLFCKYGR